MGLTTWTISDGLGPYFLLSKERKNAANEGRNGWEGVYFPPESASFVFIVNVIKVLFHICTLKCRVNIYLSRQGNCINRRNESTNIIIEILHCTVQPVLTTFQFG